jgi:type III pantothenate kinase
MFLLIDAGNSRIKFACHDGQSWLEQGVLASPTHLLHALPAGFRPHRTILSCVASEAVRASLQAEISSFKSELEILLPSESRCGLQCAYANPARLGPDRWAAAIGAWQHIQDSCLVVCAGTATTIDVIRAPGVHAGGSILPGLEMMMQSLAQGTAALPPVTANPHPKLLHEAARDTVTAIQAGCLHAQIGAIERMHASLPSGSPILVTGGNADLLAAHLNAASVLPWLIMDGLLAIAKNPPAKPMSRENS